MKIPAQVQAVLKVQALVAHQNQMMVRIHGYLTATTRAVVAVIAVGQVTKLIILTMVRHIVEHAQVVMVEDIKRKKINL